MEKYIVSPNIGLVGTNYNSYQIFDSNGNVVAIAMTNKENNKLLILKRKEETDKERLLSAIKARFDQIDVADWKEEKWI